MNFLFACTPSYFKYLSVTLLSLLDRCFIQNIATNINIHILYINIGNDTLNCSQGKNLKNKLLNIAKRFDTAKLYFYDVSDQIDIFKGQNVGQWRPDISLTHYAYLLAPIVLKDIDTVLYLDTDLIVSRSPICLFKELQNKNIAIGMATPSGDESILDQSNSGVVYLNLDYWRKNNLLDDLLQFGRNIERCSLCDQNLLYRYFTKEHPNLIFYFDRRWNLFPHRKDNHEDVYIRHYAGLGKKPWHDPYAMAIDKDLWWYYARLSPYYEEIIFNDVDIKLDNVSQKVKYLDNRISTFEDSNNNILDLIDKKHKDHDLAIKIINNKWKILLLYKFYRILKELKLPYNSAQFTKYKKYRNLVLEYSLK